MKDRYRLAIFDLDGTLIELELDAFLDQALEIVAKLGYPQLQRQELRQFAAQNNFYGFVPEPEREEFRMAFNEMFDEKRLPPARPLDRALDTLEQLAVHGVKLTIATARASLSHELEEALQHTGFLQYITVITSRGRDIRNWRDKRDQILSICKVTEIPPHQAFMAGDSPVDITSAHNAGAGLAIALLSGAFDHDALARFKPDLILPDISHIPPRYG